MSSYKTIEDNIAFLVAVRRGCLTSFLNSLGNMQLYSLDFARGATLLEPHGIPLTQHMITQKGFADL